jgi:GNAT superfamily N-acetyltransferase
MIELDDDKTRLDIGRVHGWLASSYWTPGISRALVERGIAGSHCLGAYAQGEQVGFARAITDHASFAWIADVWVDESVRGQGIARRMVRWFVDHPDFKDIRRIALVTADDVQRLAGDLVSRPFSLVAVGAIDEAAFTGAPAAVAPHSDVA